MSDEIPLGARLTEQGACFRIYSTQAERLAVRLVDQSGKRLAEHPLVAVGGGEYEAAVPGVSSGALYKYLVDDRELPDPFARFLPFGVNGPAMVVESKYEWQHGPGVSRPLREHVIYELHVGTFTAEGTYRSAISRLKALAQLGITAVELMPVHAFAGNRGWGYEGVAHFAPFAPYGHPDDLRAFVDAAHGLGLSVLLDVVYNHFGPAGNYLRSFSPEYFSESINNGWGAAPDFSRSPMRSYVLHNAIYWLREFRFDGLRLDATHAITDHSPKHILRELADRIATIQPTKLLIAEDERNDPDVVQEQGLHGVWADDFHHAMRVVLTGEREGYYSAFQPAVETIARTIGTGWLYTGQNYAPTGKRRGKSCAGLPAESLIYCIQNHDQIGNRALGDRLTDAISVEAYCTASTVLLFLPMTPLLFMGQEWGASTPFQFFTDHEPELGRLVSEGRRREFKDFKMFASTELREKIPDPQAPATFERSRLDWRERERPPHQQILNLYSRLIRLRAEDPVMRGAGRKSLDVRARGDVLVVRRWNNEGTRLLVANFGESGFDLQDFGPLARRQVLFDSANPDVGAAAVGKTVMGAPNMLTPKTALILA